MIEIPIRLNIKTEEDRVGFLLSHGVGLKYVKEYAKCKSCRQEVELRETDITNRYFIHPCSSHHVKTNISERNKYVKKFFEFSYKNLIKKLASIFEALDDVVFRKEDVFWVLTANGIKVPIFLLGPPQSNSYLNDSIEKKSKSLIICLTNDQPRDYQTVFSQNNFILIDEVLKDKTILFKKAELISLENSIVNQALHLNVIIGGLRKKLDNAEMEDLFIEWFNLLGTSNNNAEQFLELLRKNKGNFKGTKFIPTTKTYPSDAESISLFDYFNQVFEASRDKAYEIKGFSANTKFGKSMITKKMDTNKSKKMVFLVTTQKILPNAWIEVLEYYRTHGFWYILLLDLDLIIRMALGSGTKSFFENKLKNLS